MKIGTRHCARLAVRPSWMQTKSCGISPLRPLSRLTTRPWLVKSRFFRLSKSGHGEGYYLPYLPRNSLRQSLPLTWNTTFKNPKWGAARPGRTWTKRQVNRQIKGRQTPDLDAAFALREQLLEALQIGGNLACGMVSICVLHGFIMFYTCLRGGLRS